VWPPPGFLISSKPRSNASNNTGILDRSNGTWRYWSGKGVVSTRVGALSNMVQLPFMSGKWWVWALIMVVVGCSEKSGLWRREGCNVDRAWLQMLATWHIRGWRETHCVRFQVGSWGGWEWGHCCWGGDSAQWGQWHMPEGLPGLCDQAHSSALRCSVYVIIGFRVRLDSPILRNRSSKGPHPHWWWCEWWQHSLLHHSSGKNGSAMCHSPKMNLKRWKGLVKLAPLQCLTQVDVSKQKSRQIKMHQAIPLPARQQL
jgi:hypothetical protein